MHTSTAVEGRSGAGCTLGVGSWEGPCLGAQLLQVISEAISSQRGEEGDMQRGAPARLLTVNLHSAATCFCGFGCPGTAGDEADG